MKLSRILTGLAVVAAVVGVGLIIGWFATRDSNPHHVAQPLAPTNDMVSIPAPAPPPIPVPTRQPPPRPVVKTITNPPIVHPMATQVSVATNLPATGTNWEDRLDEILASDSDDTNKVKQLFAMFPKLPEDGQEEIAQHLSNLVEDEDYGPLGELLKNAKLPEAVLDVLMSDLLNRPNSSKLPLFLDIAQNPDHPKAGEAKELLELYLDEDYGNNWSQWKNEMQKWLKENPD